MKQRFLNFGTHRQFEVKFNQIIFLAIAFAAGLTHAGLSPGSFVTKGSSTSKKIALTFDDGPGPQTSEFVNLLDRYGVKGTFFMLGEQVKYRSALAKTVADKGHEIASHTMTHRNYLKHLKSIESAKGNAAARPAAAVDQARQDLINDMADSRNVIENATGQKLKLLRMPHGIDRPWIKEAAKAAGFVLVNWTYGSDWLTEPEEKLKSAYLKAIQPGAILLFHDGGSKRAKSLALAEAVIKAAQEQGYEIVTVGELLGIK